MKIYNVQIKTMEKRRSIENGWIEIETVKSLLLKREVLMLSVQRIWTVRESF